MTLETKIALVRGIGGVAGIMTALKDQISDKDWLDLDIVATDFLRSLERHLPSDIPRLPK